MTSILQTGCHELLPGLIKPFFTSHTFVPHPSSTPIPVYGALLPPLTYYLALFLLSHPRPTPSIAAARDALAAIAAVSFFALPFQYHVPGSAIFTYQLGLIGCFGSARVVDVFLLSRPRVPRRITIPQPAEGSRKPLLGVEDAEVDERNGRVYPHTDNLDWAVEPHPQTLTQRLWWALDLMISMRGIGWDFASADVRHDVSPWQPPSRRQVRTATFKLLPALAIACVTARVLLLYVPINETGPKLHLSPSIVDIPPILRPLMVLATGISLYTLFDCGYTIVSAILLPAMKGFSSSTDSPLHNVDFFPLLNPLKLTEIRSVRSFWSKAWHRLFHRAFLVFGILPLQNLALWLFPVEGCALLSSRSHPDPGRMLPKGTHDWAKVLGAFFASGLVHAISERAALGGRLALPANNIWLQTRVVSPTTAAHLAVDDGYNQLNLNSVRGLAGHVDPPGKFSVSRIVPPISGAGEFTFFALNGFAVLIEGLVWSIVRQRRKQALLKQRFAEAGSVHSQMPRRASEDEVDADVGPGSSSDAGRTENPAGRLLPGASSFAPRPLMGTAGMGGLRRKTFEKPRRPADFLTRQESAGHMTIIDQDMDDEADEAAETASNASDVTVDGSAIKQPGTPPDQQGKAKGGSAGNGSAEIDESELERPYDRYIGLAWAVTVLLWSGEAFVEGWIKSGVLSELTFAPH